MVLTEHHNFEITVVSARSSERNFHSLVIMAKKNKIVPEHSNKGADVLEGALNSSSKNKKPKLVVEKETPTDGLLVSPDSAPKVSKRQRAEAGLALELAAQPKISKRSVSAEDAAFDDNVSKATSEVSNVSAIVPTEEELKSLADSRKKRAKPSTLPAVLVSTETALVISVINEESVAKLENTLHKMAVHGAECNHLQFCNDQAKFQLQVILDKSLDDIHEMPREAFLMALKKFVSADGAVSKGSNVFVWMQQLRLGDKKIKSASSKAVVSLASHVNKLLIADGFDPLTCLNESEGRKPRAILLELLKQIMDKSWSGSNATTEYMTQKIAKPLDGDAHIATFVSFWTSITRFITEKQDILAENMVFLPSTAVKDTTKTPYLKPAGVSKTPGAANAAPKPTGSLCNHCGRDRHATAACPGKAEFSGLREQYFNPVASIPYLGSTQQKKLFSDTGCSFIPPLGLLRNKMKKCKSIVVPDALNAMVNTNTEQKLLFTVTLHAQNGASKDITAFADPGAVDGSYASATIAKWLAENGTASCACHRIVCGAVGDNRCVQCNECHVLQLSLIPDARVNNLVNLMSFELAVAVIPKLQYDIVVGLPAFRKHKLFLTLAPLLQGGCQTDNILETKFGPRPGTDSKGTCVARPVVSLIVPPSPSIFNSVDKQQNTSRLRERPSSMSWPLVEAQVIYDPPCRVIPGSAMLRDSVNQTVYDTDTQCHKSPIWVEPESWSRVCETHTNLDDVPGWLTEDEVKSLPPNAPTKIWGTKHQRRDLMLLCLKHICIFSRTLNPQPALVPPMTFKVDEERWFNRSNQQPPRPMNPAKQSEISRRTDELIAQGVIKPFRGRAWSQCVLVAKPDGKLRLTHDFRRLNDCTESQSWPIPNIPQMLDRLGAKRPKFFGICDLKDGYFQAPLAANCSEYTCFTTFSGIYAYNRVAMGLKGAVGYFQMLMIAVIFATMIYIILEVYLDDMVVHDESKGFKQFLVNVGRVFERIEVFKLLIHPDKTILGVPQVTFVGHTIDESGKHFSREKLDSVLEIELPVWGKGLKSFLGVANWFSDHVRDFRSKTKILQDLVRDYEHTKNRKIPWTAEGIAAFNQIKREINECTKLFFVNDAWPIYLNTDASDYGIGGYLYQIDEDGKEIPIAFMSKALTVTQMGWSTYEKEGYAIYAAVMKFYHLQDREKNRGG